MRQARIDRPVDKRRAPRPLLQAAFKLASFLRHSGLAHAFVNVLALLEEDRIVARAAVPEAPDREGRIEQELVLASASSLLDLVRSWKESGRKKDVGGWRVWVGSDRLAEPFRRLLIGAEVDFGHAIDKHPVEGERVPRREV